MVESRVVTVPSFAIVLVFGCALAFSGADISRKLLAGWVRPVPLLFGLAAGMAPFFIVWHLQQAGSPRTSAYWAPGLRFHADQRGVRIWRSSRRCGALL